MTPELKQYIRIARLRVQGIPLTSEILRAEEERLCVDKFRKFLRAKVGLDVWVELLACGEFLWTPEGCSVEFSVDHTHFLLNQLVNTFRLYRKFRKQDVPLQVLKDDVHFADNLLIAIGDALDKARPSD